MLKTIKVLCFYRQQNKYYSYTKMHKIMIDGIIIFLRKRGFQVPI